MNKNQLANKIWASANKMRSKIEANEYKDFILGFIFYKFLSDNERSLLRDAGFKKDDLPLVTEDHQEVLGYVQRNLGYFISYDNLFSTWIDQGRDFSIAEVRDALSAFERLIHPYRKKLFGGIFDTLHSGLSKLGTSEAEQSKAVSDLLALIREIPTDGKQDYDVLGFVYEYLISNFAANAGKKAGEFYTPHEVSVLMSDIIAHHLRNQEEIRIYDPTSGSGSLLINIGKSVSRHIASKDNIKYYAQELKQATYNLTRMNLIMRGIKPANIEVRNGDTLQEDWPYFDDNDPHSTYEPLYVDAVVSNPPYSQQWDPTDKENDPRYKDFGLAPKGKADFAFLLHDLYHVKPRGIMTIVLPHGVLYRGKSEQQESKINDNRSPKETKGRGGGSEWAIRRALIEFNHIDTIIGLPEKVFFGTGISTIIMVLKRPETRQDESVLFVDASQGFAKEGKNNKLRASDIRKIVDTVTERKEVPDFSRLVSRGDIRANDYNLNITRYVDSSPSPEQYDIYATMFGGIPAQDLDLLAPYWEAFPSLRAEVLEVNPDGYSHLRGSDTRALIGQNADVKRFVSDYAEAFGDFDTFLFETFVRPMLTLNILQSEDEITKELFRRLSAFPLIDPYEAYQFVSDEWTQISTDLEILQTEGSDAIHAVDPNMVLKKKDGKEIEVQEGWVGRILPFDLVQREKLPERLATIEALEGRLEEIDAELEMLIETLPEEARDSAILNEDNTKFDAKELGAEAKRLKKETDDTPEYRDAVTQALSLLNEAKAKRKLLKSERQTIELETIELIRSIAQDDATRLLRFKWITPIMDSLDRMPGEIVGTLTTDSRSSRRSTAQAMPRYRIASPRPRPSSTSSSATWTVPWQTVWGSLLSATP